MVREGKFIITGRPGSGKSTCVAILMEGLRSKGIGFGGIRTPEVREGGIRTGFIVEDLLTGDRDLFASVKFSGGPSVSKYVIDLRRFESIAIPALTRAAKECKVIIIDEIGKMELLSNKFVEIVREVWRSNSIVVATAPLAKISEVEELKRSSEVICMKRGEAERVAGYLLSRICRQLNAL
ncbi:MAG: nucleoside-triphosphatase [Candidatus Korarchaeum sp.]